MRLILFLTVFGISASSMAQGNVVEARQNKREQRDDWKDLKKLEVLRSEIESHVGGADAATVARIDQGMKGLLAQEWGEGVFERGKANAELRRSRREAKNENREARDDRRDLRDDRRDQRRERRDTKRLMALGKRYKKVSGRGDTEAMKERLALTDALISLAKNEVVEGRKERREDRRERHEDRRERRRTQKGGR